MTISRTWTGLALALSLAASGCEAPETEGSTDSALTAAAAASANRPSATSKIAIVGAGPSGLAAALQLRANGYRNVTVFERNPVVGGKVMSVNVLGAPTELGAVFASDDYTTILALAKKYSIPYTASTLPQYVVTGKNTRQTFQDYLKSLYPGLAQAEILTAAYAFQSTMDLFNKFYPKDKGFVPQVTSPADLVSLALLGDIWQNFDSYAALHGFTPVATLLKGLMIGFGYGYYDTAPAAYYLKLANWLLKTDLSLGAIAAQTFLKPATYYTWPTGYQSLWEAVGSDLNNVLTSTSVSSITRSTDAKTGKVTINLVATGAHGGTYSFDDVIISASFDKIPGFLKDPTPDEARLFAEVKSEYYAVSLFTASGLPTVESDFIVQNFDSSRTDWPAVWANSAPVQVAPGYYPYIAYTIMSGPTANPETLLAQQVSDFGGSFGATNLVQTWDNYFPHVAADNSTRGSDSKAGSFYGDVDSKIQGVKIPTGILGLPGAPVPTNTFYVGGTLSFETVEHSADTSASITNAHFPCLGTSCPAITK